MIQFSEKQKKIIKAPFDATLEVNEGTPRSAKTTGGVFRFARYLLQTRDENHLVVAYNAEQAYRLIMDCDGFGLEHIFGNFIVKKSDSRGEYMELTTHNGLRKIYWKGGGKADSHKAITGLSLGSVVFCEINLLHMDFIQECFRRTFSAKDRFHLADLNPPAPNHPIIEKVFKVQKTRWTHWTPEDNPILTDERKAELKATLSKSPYLYARDWLGQRVQPEGVIYSEFDRTKHFKSTIGGEIVEMYFTADGGQSDATSASCHIVVKSYEGGRPTYKLYRAANYYHSGRDTGKTKAMSKYASEIVEFIQWCIRRFNTQYTNLFVDPACKSLREELHLLGYETEKADNNAKDRVKGSSGVKVGIEAGIERVNTCFEKELLYFLEEAEKYGHYSTLEELSMYCRDKNGNPIDDYNHALDELRYAVNYFYKNYVL